MQFILFYLDFSVALNRGTFKNQEQSTYDPNLGYVAFGGIAPVKTSSPVVTVPVQAYSISSNSSAYRYYTVDIDSYVYNGSTTLTGSGKQAILDTGTTLNLLPNEVAKAYNAKFVPPADYDEDQGAYFVNCNATVPAFQVQIGGQQFKIDGKDQILPVGVDDGGNEICISGTQNGGNPSNTTRVFILCVKSPCCLSTPMLRPTIVSEETCSCTMWLRPSTFSPT
jgi:hypothetical protein